MKKRLISVLCAVASFVSMINFSLAEEENSDKLYVLSANTWKESSINSDSGLYRSKGIELENLNTGATYEWTSSSDKGIRESDAVNSVTGEKIAFKGNEMQGGNIEDTSGNTSTHATWNKETTGTVIYDLKDVFWVSRVDVWSQTKNNIQIGDVVIRVSENKEDFKSIGSFSPESIPSDEEIASKGYALTYSPCVFPATMARYVEVTYTTKPGKKQTILSEIVVFGSEKKPVEITEAYEEEKPEDVIGVFSNPEINERNNIIIPLEDTAEITKINMNQYQSEASGVESFEVYLSNDGEIYSWIGKCENNNSTTFKSRIISYLMPYKAYAKYLKIKVNPQSGKKPLVSEIEIVGRKGAEQIQPENVSYSYYVQNPYKTSDDIRAMDSNNTKLTDKDTENCIKTNNQYATVVMDLGKPYQVGEVEIYSLSEGNTFMEGCELKYSFDGKKFFSYGYYLNKNERDAGGVVKSTFSGLPGKNARYLKVIAQSSTKEIALSEITVNCYDVEQKNKPEIQKVPIRVDMKNYALCYIDWSTYNSSKVSKYAIYIEKQNFTNTVGKTPVRVIESYEAEFVNKYTTHTILEPDTEYYIAVTPFDEYGKELTEVTPTKIKTRGVIGNRPVDIFNVVQHPLWGDANAASQRYGSKWEVMYNENIRLMDELEAVGKTRWYHNTPAGIDPFSKVGITTMIMNINQLPLSISQGNYLFSVGNEHDLSLKDTTNYFNQMKQYRAKMKAADERAVLCGPVLGGTTKSSLDWFEEIYQAGEGIDAKNTYDYVDVHFYCKNTYPVPSGLPICAPEGLIYQIRDVREVMAKYGDGDKPIICTEIGWQTSDVPGFQTVIDYDTQRDFIVRMYMIMMSHGVREVWHYCFQDDSITYSNPDAWGLIDYFGVPKPSYYGYYNLANQVKYADFVGDLQGAVNPYYGMVFFDESKEKYISSIWAADNKEKMIEFETLSGEDEVIEIIGTDGSFKVLQTVNGKASTKITGAPIFIYSDKGISVNEINVAFSIGENEINTQRGGRFTVEVKREEMGGGVSGNIVGEGLPAGWYIDGETSFNEYDETIPVTIVVPDNTEEKVHNFNLVMIGSDGNETKINVKTHVVPAIEYYIRFENTDDNFELWNVIVDCTNTVETPQDVTLQIMGTEGIAVQEMEKKEMENLLCGETRTVKFPVKRISNEEGAYISFKLSAGDAENLFDRSMNFSACINDGITPEIDGVINESEWSGCDVLVQDSTRRSTWISEDDLSFKIYRKWDENNFYMAVDVLDDVFFQNQVDSLVYNGDNLQIAMDFGRKNGVATPNSEYYEYGITRNDNNELMSWVWMAGLSVHLNRDIPSITGAVNRTEDNHTIYEFSIPWGYFVEDANFKHGDMIGFSFVVNDNDGVKRKGWLKYMGGIVDSKAPDKFEDMVLIKK